MEGEGERGRDKGRVRRREGEGWSKRRDRTRKWREPKVCLKEEDLNRVQTEKEAKTKTSVKSTASNYQ